MDSMRRKLISMLTPRERSISGNAPLSFRAKAGNIKSLKQYGKCVQDSTPTPDAPVDIVCNNGVLKVRHQSGLPLGYTLLEYIESTGTQYIDTGYFFTDIATETVTIDFMRTDTGAGSLLYGTRKAYKNNGYAIQFLDSGNTYMQYGEIDSGIGATAPGALNTRYTLIQTGPTYSFLGASYTSTGATPTQSYPLYLFGVNNSGSVNIPTPMRVYSFVIKDSNNNIKLNLVPCKNASNVVGMYDLVSGQFFTNADTGDFVAGTAVSDPVEIYTDGTVETINAHGKNLFDKNSYEEIDGYIGPDGTLTVASGSFNIQRCVVFNVEPNTMYKISGILESHYGSFQTKTVNSVASSFITGNGILTTGSNDNYIIGLIRTTSGTYDYRDTLVFEKCIGSATAEMLLNVGDYQDVQSIIDGVVTRNVGVKVLDGTEDWVAASGSFTGSYYCNNILPNLLLPTSGGQVGVVTHFEIVLTASELVLNKAFISATSGGRLNLFWGASTVEQFKSWLANQYAAGTPVTIIYPLATATTDTVTPQSLRTRSGNNTIEVDSNVDPVEIEVKYRN